MKRRTKIAAGLVAIAALALGGAAIANATQSGGKLTQGEAAKASAAALRATGGGKVQAYERDNENGATFEVEVRKTDGSVVDVRLDASYNVVVVDGDQESNDDGGGNEDSNDG
jgi:hypothetical protein